MQDHFVLFLALTSPFSTNVNPHQLRHGGFEAHAPGHHGGTEEADRRRQRPGGQPLQLSGSHAWHAAHSISHHIRWCSAPPASHGVRVMQSATPLGKKTNRVVRQVAADSTGRPVERVERVERNLLHLSGLDPGTPGSTPGYLPADRFSYTSVRLFGQQLLIYPLAGFAAFWQKKGLRLPTPWRSYGLNVGMIGRAPREHGSVIRMLPAPSLSGRHARTSPKPPCTSNLILVLNISPTTYSYTLQDSDLLLTDCPYAPLPLQENDRGMIVIHQEKHPKHGDRIPIPKETILIAYSAAAVEMENQWLSP